MCRELRDYCQLKWQEMIDATSLIAASIYNDNSANLKIIKYPFLGIKECFSTTRYGYLMFTIFLNYLVAFVSTGLVYFYLLFPLSVVLYSMFLGPAGLIFAFLHGLAISNIVACHETRVSSRYFMNTIYTLRFNEKEIVPKIRYIRDPFKRINYESIPWITFIIISILKWAFFLLKLGIWYAISLIPVFGIILFKIQSSSSRGFSYFLPYFKYTGKLDDKRLKYIYYSAYGQWSLFGLTTGLLEAIPIVSGLTICTNTCGCALWEIDRTKRMP